MLIPKKEDITIVIENLTLQSGYDISNDIDVSAISYFISFSESTNNGICDTATISLSPCLDGVCSHYFNVSSFPCSLSTNDIAISVFATNMFGSGSGSSRIVKG